MQMLRSFSIFHLNFQIRKCSIIGIAERFIPAENRLLSRSLVIDFLLGFFFDLSFIANLALMNYTRTLFVVIYPRSLWFLIRRVCITERRRQSCSKVIFFQFVITILCYPQIFWIWPLIFGDVYTLFLQMINCCDSLLIQLHVIS